MGIRDLLDKLRAKKERFNEFDEEQKIKEKWIERQKSSNERELERFMKEEREEAIKHELEEFRKKRRKEIEFGHQILKAKNMFSNEGKGMLAGKEILHNDSKQLQGGNVFFK